MFFCGDVVSISLAAHVLIGVHVCDFELKYSVS
jgi:hypothetical protein